MAETASTSEPHPCPLAEPSNLIGERCAALAQGDILIAELRGLARVEVSK